MRGMRALKPNAMIASLLPGFAPILLYIAVEAAFGERAGLVAGMALGLGEFAFILARERRVDAFTLVDTALLAAMGALSWALADPVFFRVKPAISEAILAAMMLVGSLGPHRYFLPYMESKLGLGAIPESAARRMVAMIAGFALVTLVHAGLTALAALYGTKAQWDFVAGALFWILSLAYAACFIVPALLARGKSVARGGEETLPIVDDDGRVIGKAARSRCHSGEKPLHPVVRLWLSDGETGFYLQKRSMAKLVQPGKWDCAVGGHVSFGETAETALEREASEEIGLAPLPAIHLLARFAWETAIERELVFVYYAELGPASPLTANLEEVDEIRLWTAKEIAAELAKGDAEREFTELARKELRDIFDRAK